MCRMPWSNRSAKQVIGMTVELSQIDVAKKTRAQIRWSVPYLGANPRGILGSCCSSQA